MEVPEYGQVPVSYDDLFVNGKLDLYPEVVGKKFFSFYLQKDNLIFQAGGYVGLIPINDRVVLDVRPRVPVRNLERLLQLTSQTPVALSYVREYATLLAPNPSLLDILARELLAGLSQIEAHGLQKEYLRQTADTSFPRGRFLIGETVQRHLALGRTHAAAVSWFEHSPDTGVNRCLKYAIWLLAQRYRALTFRKGQAAIAAELNRAYQLFGRVSLDGSRSFLRDALVTDPSRIPALRAYYEPLVRLAVTIIENRGISFERRGAGLMLPSMVFDFDLVFEKYVRRVLEVQLAGSGIRALDGNLGAPVGARKPLFDVSARDEPAKPDVVLKPEDSDECLVVLDGKYKPVDYPDRSDIEQAIGYGFSYRCRDVVLVHPKKDGGAPGMRPIGTMQGYRFHQYVIDLAAEDPEAEEKRFADSVRGLATAASSPTGQPENLPPTDPA